MIKFIWFRSANTCRCGDVFVCWELTADIGDFTPGKRRHMHRELALAAPENLGAFICYEAIFPDEVRRFTVNGAELLINVSNDGWFGRSARPRST